MTDTRLPDRWLHNPKFDDLSNEAWRLFTLAMMWSNQQGTDGAVSNRYLRMLHPDVDPACVSELEVAGLVTTTDDGIQFVDWTKGLGQSSAQSVTDRRNRAAAHMREVRASQRLSGARGSAHVSAHVGPGLGLEEASFPSAYVDAHVSANQCAKHPQGDTGEPCLECMRVRQARDARRLDVSQATTARGLENRCNAEGHLFPTPDDNYCHRCSAKRSEVA